MDVQALYNTIFFEMRLVMMFKGVIKCKDCGKKYMKRIERGTIKYICSGSHNYGSDFCKRHIIHEEDLLKIVIKHLELNGSQKERERLVDYVEVIEIENEEIKIKYIDGSESFWGHNKLIY
jgi:hypothetical protein